MSTNNDSFDAKVNWMSLMTMYLVAAIARTDRFAKLNLFRDLKRARIVLKLDVNRLC